MRASRLISLLLLLQTRGQMTAAELATELEVSERTVHRDIEALSGAGIPVYAARGRHGGVALVEGYRTRLTGMTAEEAEALFLSGVPGPAAELGLGTVMAAARLKVLAALPPELRSRASRLVERFHLDVTGWFHTGEEAPLLGTLSEAVWEGRAVDVVYDRGDRSVDRRIHPLGLVLKAGIWYVVAETDGQVRTYRVARVRSATVTDERVRATGWLRARRLLGRVDRRLRERCGATRSCGPHRSQRPGRAGRIGRRPGPARSGIDHAARARSGWLAGSASAHGVAVRSAGATTGSG